MQRDTKLIESDPIALSELQQMTDDALDHLQKIIDRLVVPSKEGARWYYEGQQIEASSNNPSELAVQDYDKVFQIHQLSTMK